MPLRISFAEVCDCAQTILFKGQAGKGIETVLPPASEPTYLAESDPRLDVANLPGLCAPGIRTIKNI